MVYNYDQLKPGQEKLKSVMTMLIDEHGNCQMRRQIAAHLDALNEVMR